MSKLVRNSSTTWNAISRFACIAALVLPMGCAGIPDDANENQLTEDLSVTFAASCTGASFHEGIDSNEILFISQAQASACRRIDGTWTGFVSWSGRCYTDIANCNGVLRCGGC